MPELRLKRVLLVTSPGAGHVFPLVPLAWALRSAGHDVLFASAGAGVAHAAHAGLLAVDTALEADMEQVFRDGGRAMTFSDTVTPAERQEGAVALFAEVNRVMLEGIRRCARAWRPDVIVYGSLEVAGAIVAAELGIPGVEHAISPAARTGVMVSDMWTRIVDTAPVDPIAGIGIAPASIAPTPKPGWAMRAVPYNGGAAVPDDLLTPSQRPRVLLTMGTVAPVVGGVNIVRDLIDTIADDQVDLLVALGGSDPTTLGPLPPSVHPYQWLPLTAALPHCAALIHHGGAGTTLSALTLGVPQVIIPQGADQFLNAAVLRERGCARMTTAEPEHVRAALAAVLGGELDVATAEVRHEMNALLTPTDVASALIDLIDSP